MKNRKIYKQISKDLRKFGVQDLNEMQVMDSIQTGNIQMKQEGAPTFSVENKEEYIWIVAMVLAVWNSFDSKNSWENEWVNAVDKVVPRDKIMGEY